MKLCSCKYLYTITYTFGTLYIPNYYCFLYSDKKKSNKNMYFCLLMFINYFKSYKYNYMHFLPLCLVNFSTNLNTNKTVMCT